MTQIILYFFLLEVFYFWNIIWIIKISIAYIILIIFLQKKEKKVWNVQFLTKAIAIYFKKKTNFNNKNNYKDGKLDYF